MKLLQVNSSVQGAQSVSRRGVAAAVKVWQELHPDGEVEQLDLVEQPLPHWLPDAEGTRQAGPLARRLLAQVRSADALVVGAPMYNFSVPTQLKAWLDHLAVPGEAFRYTAQGPEGLLPNIPTVIVSTRGGQYTQAPGHIMDFQEPYLKALLGFMGITDVRVLRAEGLGMGVDPEQAMGQALPGIWA